MDYIVKPQTPLMLGENGLYPLTTYDQVIMPDGTRWNGKASGGGEEFTGEISYDQIIMPDGTYWNGMAGGSYRIFFTLTVANWTKLDTGRYTQLIEMKNITTHTNLSYIDVDMSNVTEDTIDAIQEAHSCINKVETVDGGILFTAYKTAPAIDLDIVADVITIHTSIPSAGGVSF